MSGIGVEKKSLKSAQLNAIHRMLSLNDDGDNNLGSNMNKMSIQAYNDAPAGTSYYQWKILIYD